MSKQSYRLRWTLALRDSRYDSTAKLVGLTLATYMDASGHCWPGREELARKTTLDVRTVDRAIARLETAQWLSVKRGGSAKGEARESNRYWATFPTRGTESLVTRGADDTDQRHRVAGREAEMPTTSGTESPELSMNGSSNSLANPSAPDGEISDDTEPDNPAGYFTKLAETMFRSPT